MIEENNSDPAAYLRSSDFEFSNHAINMLEERNIPREWVMLALEYPDRTEIGADNNVHYIKESHD